MEYHLWNLIFSAFTETSLSSFLKNLFYEKKLKKFLSTNMKEKNKIFSCPTKHTLNKEIYC